MGHGVVGLPINGGMCNKTFYIHTCIKRFFILLEVCLFKVLVTTGCMWTNQAVLFEQRMCHLEGFVVEHGIHTCRYTDVHDAHALEASYTTLPMEQ